MDAQFDAWIDAVREGLNGDAERQKRTLTELYCGGTMAEPADVGMMSRLLDWAWAGVLALGGLVWRQQDGKLKDVKDEVKDVKDLVEDQRRTSAANVAKIFDSMATQNMRSEDRHVELLQTIHNGLASKADK